MTTSEDTINSRKKEKKKKCLAYDVQNLLEERYCWELLQPSPLYMCKSSLWQTGSYHSTAGLMLAHTVFLLRKVWRETSEGTVRLGWASRLWDGYGKWRDLQAESLFLQVIIKTSYNPYHTQGRFIKVTAPCHCLNKALSHQLYYGRGEHSSVSVSLQCTDSKTTKLLWLQLNHMQASGIYLEETQTTLCWHNQW